MSDGEAALTAAGSVIVEPALDCARAPAGLQGLSASQVLEALASETDPPRVNLDSIVSRLGDRAFGMLMILLACANCLPLPPGGSTVFGVALMLVAAQLVFALRRPWVPGFIRLRSVTRDHFRLAVEKVAPILRRLERLCRPRLPALSSAAAERLVGLVVIVLAAVISLPIPIIGNLPPAVVVGILAISLIERDGLGVLIGLLLAPLVVALNAGVVTAAALGTAEGVQQIMQRLF